MKNQIATKESGLLSEHSPDEVNKENSPVKSPKWDEFSDVQDKQELLQHNHCSLLVAVLLMICSSVYSQTLTWTAPTNYAPQGYVIFHGTTSGAYSDCLSAGAATNFAFTGPLSTGANYFVVTSWRVDEASNLLMSSWSNEAVVTNTPAFVLATIILTATNIVGGCWRPLQTNSMVLYAVSPTSFFTASNSLRLTNIITVPNP